MTINVADQNNNPATNITPAEIIASDVERLIRGRARSIDELAGLLDRSLPKIRGAVSYLIGEGRAHKIPQPKGAFLVGYGPATQAAAPETPPPAAGAAEAAPAAQPDDGPKPCGNPLLTPWTRRIDLQEHGREQIVASGVYPFVGAPTTETQVEEHAALMLERAIPHAIQQTVVALPSGERFVAIPLPERRDSTTIYRGTRPVGRHYIGPISDPALIDQLVKFTPDCGWSTEDEDGKAKSPKRVNAERTLIATGGMVLDATAPCSYVDHDRRFHLRCWEPRDISPKRSDAVNAWLETWGAAGAQAIRDWVSHTTDLDRPSVALALVACPGSGKDLLALAVSALFRADGGPCSAKRAAASFNADLKHTPIILASERWPAQWNGVDSDVEEIKELISSNVREINAKFSQPVKQIGCIRLMLTANRWDFLPAPGSLDRRSLQAILDRFLVVEAPMGPDGLSAPAAHLADAGGYALTDYWLVGQDGGPGELVRHLAYLRTIEISRPDPSGRFGVATLPSKLGTTLLARSKVAGAVISGLVAQVAGDAPKALPSTALRVGGGRVLVQVGQLYGAWSTLVARRGVMADVLDARRMAPGEADFAHVVTGALAEPGDVAVQGDARTWKSLRLDVLLEHAAALGHDIETITARINAAN